MPSAGSDIARHQSQSNKKTPTHSSKPSTNVPSCIKPNSPRQCFAFAPAPAAQNFFPDNTGLGNICLPQPGNSWRARLRPGSSALTSTENQDSLVPAAALLEVNTTPRCPLSEISYREDGGKDGSSSLGLTTFPLAAIEATLGLDCP